LELSVDDSRVALLSLLERVSVARRAEKWGFK